jgi:hypothetical protein
MIASTTSDMISLTQLTPSNCIEKHPVKQLQIILKNHLCILQLTSDALRRFQAGIMPDPLVGENACQIRTSLYTRLAKDPIAMTKLEAVALQVDEVRNRLLQVDISKGKNSSFMELLEKNGADLQVPSIVCPIVFGHMLTISKKSDLSIKKEGGVPKICLAEEIDPATLQMGSVHAGQAMIKKARQTLSELSITHLQQEAALLRIEGPKDVLIDRCRLSSTPMLPGMQILLSSIKAHRTPIVLKNRMIDAAGIVTGAVILVAQADQRGRLQIVETVDPNCPAMIIEAACISGKPRTDDALKAEMMAIGIESIILANSAAHPQYGGMSKGIEPPRSEEREALKALAFEKGLCEANPDLCQIFHVFPGKVGAHAPVGAA